MSNKKGGLLKFVAGIGVGVGLGMLFSPKKGEELRRDVKLKLNDLVDKAKEIDLKEASDEFVKKVNEIKEELVNMDKEKALDIAKKTGESIKIKANELLDLAKEKGTPVLERATSEVRKQLIVLTKEVLNKLESKEAK